MDTERVWERISLATTAGELAARTQPRRVTWVLFEQRTFDAFTAALSQLRTEEGWQHRAP